MGGTNVDVVARPGAAPVAATSNPGRVAVTAGGVGRNVAENLARLGTPTALVSAVGDDAHGRLAIEATAAAGVDVGPVVTVPGARTGCYVALLDDDGELVGAVSDMTCPLRPADLDVALVAAADLVVLDGNLDPDTLAAAFDAARGPVVLDPVSVPKAARLAAALGGRRLRLLSGGDAELAPLADVRADLVWERRGADGSTLRGEALRRPVETAALPVEVVDVTGAGDAMLAAWCHATLAGADPLEAAAYGHAAAALTVGGDRTVRPDLTDELVRSLL
ncbi:PfkB family carbohydrate kinase [Nocardioides marinquilinus]|uniref:PfkB family carbohydrate kinase n=1 Tax=Nocardioides marinquilinus TaxID=1210400 RepID=A0ABP9Q5V8_9ACTN